MTDSWTKAAMWDMYFGIYCWAIGSISVLFCRVYRWLRPWFGLAIGLIGSSLVVTTYICNTFKITVIITHTVFNLHVKSSQVFYEFPLAVSYRELNWTARVKVKVEVILRLTVSQSVSLDVEPHLGIITSYLLPFESYGLVFVGRPL
jgi:hypothetical protein